MAWIKYRGKATQMITVLNIEQLTQFSIFDNIESHRFELRAEKILSPRKQASMILAYYDTQAAAEWALGAILGAMANKASVIDMEELGQAQHTKLKTTTALAT